MIQRLDHVNIVVADMEAMIRYRSPPGPAAAGGPPNATGIRHIALQVRDIDRLVSAMAAGDVAFFSPVQEVPGSQVDYAHERKRLVYCRDPEGNLLELCEFS